MVEIAMAYTSDTITKGQLLQVRGDKVEAMGLGRPKEAGRQRGMRLLAMVPIFQLLGFLWLLVMVVPIFQVQGSRTKKRRLAVRRRPAAAATRRRPAAAAVPAQAVQYTADDMHVHSRSQGYTS